MTVQFSVTAANGALDGIEAAIGAGAILKIRSGPPPANCAAADTGTVGATLGLPSDWMAAASGAIKSLAGTWQDASADASMTPGHFRIYDAALTGAHIQGTVTLTGLGGNMTIDTATLSAGQSFSVTSFTLGAQNLL